jgi:alanyl-tRNA synthetase
MSERMTSMELRGAFVEFFRSRGHELVPSAPLIPKDDPTLLFTSAGMVPFKPYYLTERPPLSRAVSVQRCLRLSDLEEVGHTPYHATFFEMLGNFSFGDYFKREAIEWAWQFLTEVVRLPKDLLWVTVYRDDDAAADLWRTVVGFPAERIVRLGDKDNFWGPAGDSGPCGPCSEIHYDMGTERGCGRSDCRPGCDCDRFFEIWNLVFPQYLQHKDATRVPLARPGIDTGSGLERLSSVVQGVGSIFETDLFAPVVTAVRDEIERATGTRPTGPVGKELAIMADHARAAVFAIAENILPTNDAQGYVVRRLVRRAVRRGLALGITGPFLYRVGGVVVETMQAAHPHLAAKREHIALVLKSEEERFEATIAQGTAMFEEIVESVIRTGGTVIPGDRAFGLYDTYGFPLDLTEEMARERGLTVDAAGAATAMDAQKDRARRASSFADGAGRRSAWRETKDLGEDSVFVGYDLAACAEPDLEETGEAALSEAVEADVIGVREGKTPGDVEFVVTRTPFYAEAGGQVSDTGRVEGGGLAADVVNVYVEDGRAVHVARSVQGTLGGGRRVRLSVDLARRRSIEKNHTATHLLQAALRRVLGDHVHQSGSWVGAERLRFDLTHFSELSDHELALVEDAVNGWIRSDLVVTPERMQIGQALASGAMALFGEKYGDVVRCVSVGRVSLELCGGTHARTTGEIGAFSIVSETSVASGVRRIEAVTGAEAVRRARRFVGIARDASSVARTTPDELVGRVREMAAEIASLRKEIDRQRQKTSGEGMVALAARARDVRGVRVVSARTDAADVQALREQSDRLRDALGSGVGVIGAEIDGSAVIIAVVTDDLAGPKRIAAGDVVREAAARTGGRGGGKPRMAQAGGGDASKLDDALESVYADVERLLGS